MISKHLQEAVERFETESSSIAPICESDAKIIYCLIDIFHKIYYPELKAIIKEWKNKPDEEILYLLQLWLQEGSIPNKILIKLGDKEIPVQYIQSISLIDSYDNLKRCPVYKVIINQDGSEKLLFSNTEIVFYSDKKREEALSDFKNKTKYLKIKFI